MTDIAREIWEHSFRNHEQTHGRAAPKWENQPEHIKEIIRDKYRPGSVVKNFNDYYFVRFDGTWFHGLFFTVGHRIKERRLREANVGFALTQAQLKCSSSEEWFELRRSIIKDFERKLFIDS